MTAKLDRLERFTLGAVVYLAGSTLWIYGVLDTGLLHGRPQIGWPVVAAVGLAHVVFGFLIRDWLALLLPIAVVFLAVPAGYPEWDYEPVPLWISQTFLVIVEIPLIAVGLGLRALGDRRRGPIRSS